MQSKMQRNFWSEMKRKVFSQLKTASYHLFHILQTQQQKVSLDYETQISTKFFHFFYLNINQNIKTIANRLYRNYSNENMTAISGLNGNRMDRGRFIESYKDCFLKCLNNFKIGDLVAYKINKEVDEINVILKQIECKSLCLFL